MFHVSLNRVSFYVSDLSTAGVYIHQHKAEKHATHDALLWMYHATAKVYGSDCITLNVVSDFADLLKYCVSYCQQLVCIIHDLSVEQYPIMPFCACACITPKVGLMGLIASDEMYSLIIKYKFEVCVSELPTAVYIAAA